MKNYKERLLSLFTLTIFVSLFFSCSRDANELEEATFSNTPEVFIDGFSGDMAYEAFGESKITAFEVDQSIKYKGEASMRFDVPNSGDPAGGFAAGLFKVTNNRTQEIFNARDLSEYNVLTFWGRASGAASIDELGFGFTFDNEKYKAYIKDTPFSTTWTKYFIPIPDPSKLTKEVGLFYFVDGPDDGKGYSFWIDEVKYENLGTIGYEKASILNGEDREETASTGSKLTIGGLTMSSNLPNGVDQEVIPAPAYFDFNVVDNSVASVSELGEVEVKGEGTTTITGSIGNLVATGSLKVISTGSFIHAPTPTADPANVISLFSNAYTNVPVEYYNGFWAPFQTTLSADFTIDGDDVLSYTDFNFVGTQFTIPTIDGSEMTHLHLDLWLPNAVNPAAQFAVRIVDIGSDGTFDDPNYSTGATFTNPDPLVSQTWIGLDIPLSGLARKSNLAQVVYENLGSPLSNFYVDNLYFYKDENTGGDDMPTEAAPTPGVDAANVISVFSDTYMNIEGTNFNPDWGQGTIMSGEMIDGNNTLLYTGLDYQGIDLGSSQNLSDMDFLHLDYWTVNSTALNAFLISPGSETGIPLPVPTSGWASIDIPLTDFTAVNLMDVFQMKFDGNGNIYLDNIYFYKDDGGGGPIDPTTAAPAPTEAAEDVISIYSDAYTNVPNDGFNLYGNAGFEVVDLMGDGALKYSPVEGGGGFQVLELGGNQINAEAAGMTNFRFDLWFPDEITAESDFLLKLVDIPGSGPTEALIFVNSMSNPAISQGSWLSFDFPFSELEAAGLGGNANIQQVVVDLMDAGAVYLDNIYFYKDGNGGGGGSMAPDMPAPAPTQPAEDVISIYSNAYSNVPNDGFNLYGNALFEEADLMGDGALKYTSPDGEGGGGFQVLELGGNQIDAEAAGMTNFRFDLWFPNAVVAESNFLLKLVNIPGGGPTEAQININTGTTPPMAQGMWLSYDIPFTVLESLGLGGKANIQQVVVDLMNIGEVYLDNIYFYKDEGGGMGNEPSLPLTFEDGILPFIAFDNGATAAIIDNPDMAGNTSAKVLEFKKVVGSEWYSGIVFDENLRTTPLFDLANGTIVTFKIWSPKDGITIRCQLEGGAAPAYEVFQTVDKANEWITMTFDFTSQVNASDSYPRIAIFPDFNTSNQNQVTEEAIYYIDDITQQ